MESKHLQGLCLFNVSTLTGSKGFYLYVTQIIILQLYGHIGTQCHLNTKIKLLNEAFCYIIDSYINVIEKAGRKKVFKKLLKCLLIDR